jgi:PAS domain S-box-containing protein
LTWLDLRRSSDDRARTADQEQLTLLRGLVERHPAGILVIGDDGRVLAASAVFRRLFNSGPAESIAAPLDPAFASADPERFRRRVAQIAADRKPVASEEVVLADGRAFERDYSRLELPGGGGAHMWEYRDVTERRRAEQVRREASARLEYLVTAGAAIVYSSRPQPDYDRTFVSDNVRELVGYDAAQWTTPGFWRRTLHPEDAARVLAEVPHLRERGCQAMEYRLVHKDGHAVWVHDELRLVCEAEGQPVEIVGCLIDISARRQSEDDLAALGRMAGDAAHDFNNLLLVITGHAHLLKGAAFAAEGHRWSVEEIGRAAERAVTLVEKLQSADPRRTVAPTPSPRPTRGTETVLVVEDEDAVRVFTGRALTGSGYHVIEARRAEEALEIIARNPGTISALLTDVSMPGGMSGCELAKRLAAAQSNIKVIFMSGFNPDDPALEQMQPPPAYLQKPFSPDVLATKLREVLDN